MNIFKYTSQRVAVTYVINPQLALSFLSRFTSSNTEKAAHNHTIVTLVLVCCDQEEVQQNIS